MNLVAEYLAETGDDPYELHNQCWELADRVVEWARKARRQRVSVLHIRKHDGPGDLHALTPEGEKRWCYHAVVLSRGMIHDALFTKVMKVADYIRSVFPGQEIVVTKLSDDIVKAREIWKSGKRIKVERNPPPIRMI